MDSKQSPFHHHQIHQAYRQQPPPQQSGLMSGPPQPQPNPYNNTTTTTLQNPRFPFNSPNPTLDYGDASPPSSGFGSSSGPFATEQGTKKRGRPRKYSPDGGGGNNISLGLAPTPVTPISAVSAHADSDGGTHLSLLPSSKQRGRPAGLGKKQLDALGPPGVGFTPHVILINAGEDIASKIVSFSQQGPRTICILSANGAISNVTLRQPSTSGGTVTYEGRFQIISLTGSFLLPESNDSHSKSSGLSVSLAGSDGRVLGGNVAGTLIAATQVQVIVGSFIADGKKSKSGLSPATPSNMLNFDAGASPSPQGTSSESSDENGNNRLNHGSGPYGHSTQPIPNMQMYTNMGWPNNTVKILPH